MLKIARLLGILIPTLLLVLGAKSIIIAGAIGAMITFSFLIIFTFIYRIFEKIKTMFLQKMNMDLSNENKMLNPFQ